MIKRVTNFIGMCFHTPARKKGPKRGQREGRATEKNAGLSMPSWNLGLCGAPIQTQFTQLLARLGQIPKLQATAIHADCEMAAIRADGERNGPRRQRQ